ncbi:MAG: NHL repeat-containing protein [Chloroflexi bacterium]|nr:NHL repeat-containing protein [Chloroflexota bacterium]
MHAADAHNPQEDPVRNEPEQMGRGVPPPGRPAAGGGGWWQQRKKRRLVLLAVALIFFGITGASAAYYGITRQSLFSLPGVSAMTRALPPRYVFSITGMVTPEAVAVSADGQRIYVAESGGDRLVRLYTATGQELATLAPPGTQVSSRLPMSLALAPNGRLFVADRLRKAVDMFAPDGKYVGAYRPDAVLEEPWLPLGLSFDAGGRLLVTDHKATRHRVLVFRPNALLDTVFGEQLEGVGPLAFPYSAAVDSQGRVYVSDTNNARLLVFDAQGQLLSVVTTAEPRSGLGLPRGVAVDSQDRVYVVDAAGHTVVVYAAGDTPSFLFTFGELGTRGGELRYPSGIALDQRGRIYLADRDNNSVQVWSY